MTTSPHPQQGFPAGSVVENLPASTGAIGDVGLIPGPGRSLGGGNGNPLQYSCLENLMDRGICLATVQGFKELDMSEHTNMSPQITICYLSSLQGRRRGICPFKEKFRLQFSSTLNKKLLMLNIQKLEQGQPGSPRGPCSSVQSGGGNTYLPSNLGNQE